MIVQGPFRAPHHTISGAGLVGGGRWPRPGEISPAPRGVLPLDALSESNSRDLEVRCRPMEETVVRITWAAATLTFPASFMLVAGMNPWPCGFYRDRTRECTCSPTMVSRYLPSLPSLRPNSGQQRTRDFATGEIDAEAPRVQAALRAERQADGRPSERDLGSHPRDQEACRGGHRPFRTILPIRLTAITAGLAAVLPISNRLVQAEQ